MEEKKLRTEEEATKEYNELCVRGWNRFYQTMLPAVELWDLLLVSLRLNKEVFDIREAKKKDSSQGA